MMRHTVFRRQSARAKNVARLRRAHLVLEEAVAFRLLTF